MKLVTQVKLLPTPEQASVLVSTLRTVNDAANWVSVVAFEHDVPRDYELRKHAYAELKARGLGAQAAQHTIKKVRDAYTTLKANIRAGNLGKEGSKRRTKAESKPIAFRPEAAQPYDDRCLSWQYEPRVVSIWTTAGRLKNVRFACSPEALKMLREHRQGESDLVCRTTMRPTTSPARARSCGLRGVSHASRPPLSGDGSDVGGNAAASRALPASPVLQGQVKLTRCSLVRQLKSGAFSS